MAATAKESGDSPTPDLTAETIYDTTHVVKVQISVEEEEWNRMRRQRRDFMESLQQNKPPGKPFNYFKADVTIDGVEFKGVGIRKKGFFGSLDERRPSIKIKFGQFNPEHAKTPPIPGVPRLTLNNNKQDPAGASHLLAYEFFRESGTPASRCNTAHVTVNGKDLGIYSNVETVKRPFLKREFGKSSGLLYEGTVTDFYEDAIPRFEAKKNPARFEPLIQLTALLSEEELDVDKLSELVDIDAFVRFWASESLIGFWDGYTNDQNNFFVYQNPENSKLYFIPWGMDCAFAENMPIPPFFIKPQFVYMQSRLSNGLYRNEEIREKYHEQLKQLLDVHWDEEALLGKIDALEERIKSFNTRERESKKSLDRIRRFIKVRRTKLLKEMDRGFEPKPARIPPYTVVSLIAEGGFETKWYGGDPDDAKTLGKPELDSKLRDKPLKFRKMGVYAKQKDDKGRKEDYANVVFTGNRTNGKEAILALELSLGDFKPTEGKAIPVKGIFIDGKIGWLGTSYKPLTGSITLDQAGTEEGDTVKGTFKVDGREFFDPNRQRRPQDGNDKGKDEDGKNG